MVETRAGSTAKRADEPADEGGDTDDDGIVDDDADGAAHAARVSGPPADIRPAFGLRAVGEGDSAARPMRSRTMRSSTMPSLRSARLAPNRPVAPTRRAGGAAAALEAARTAVPVAEPRVVRSATVPRRSSRIAEEAAKQAQIRTERIAMAAADADARLALSNEQAARERELAETEARSRPPWPTRRPPVEADEWTAIDRVSVDALAASGFALCRVPHRSLVEPTRTRPTATRRTRGSTSRSTRPRGSRSAAPAPAF